MNTKRKPGSAKECIIEIATHLFATKGFEGTTVRDISQHCGITEAAIYKHYKNKKDLYEKAIANKTQPHKIQEFLDAKKGQGTIEDVLFSVATHILTTARNDPGLIRMMLFSSLEGFSASSILYKNFRLPYIRFIREELVDRITTGEVRDINPYITSRCFVGMVMDCALNSELWNNLESSSYPPEAITGNNIPIFAKGLVAD